MPARTYSLSVPLAQSYGLYPGLALLVNDQPGTRVDVLQVDVLPPGGQSATGVSNLAVQRWSALPSEDSANVSPIKYDSDSADVTLDLRCWILPKFDAPFVVDTLTRTGGSPCASPTVALAPMGARVHTAPKALRGSVMLHGLGGGTVVAPQLAQSNEVLCFVQTTCGLPHAGSIEVVVRNAASGACYLYAARVTTAPSDTQAPILALWSSGASVWEVIRAEWIVDLPATPLAGLRLVKVEEDHVTDTGDSPHIAPVAHDASFPCPSGIHGVGPALRTTPFGRSTGVPYDYDSTHGSAGWTVVSQLQAGRLRRVVRPTPGVEAGSALSPMAFGSHLLWSGHGAPITLRYEQGLGVLAGVGADVLPSAFAAGEVRFLFRVVDDDGGPCVGYVS